MEEPNSRVRWAGHRGGGIRAEQQRQSDPPADCSAGALVFLFWLKRVGGFGSGAHASDGRRGRSGAAVPNSSRAVALPLDSVASHDELVQTQHKDFLFIQQLCSLTASGRGN
jgi:hypothetical protein